MAFILLILGLALLTVGAESLVRGAAALARQVGISPLVVGLTVVAMGTSAPELAVSVKASLGGQPDLALGNVVGSNILNVLLILGLSAVIIPLTVSAQLIRLDVPVMLGVSALVWVFAADGRVAPFEGAVLFVGLLVYTALLIVLGRRAGAGEAPPNPAGGPAPQAARPPSALASVVRLVVGLVLLVLGARWLVEGASDLARMLGVGELAIGLTVVAAGTSAPEIATSLVAALRGERDLAVGNVVGSNVFNLMGVLGLSSLLAPGGVPVAAEALAFDLPVMVAVAFLCLPVFVSGGRISRAEGVLLLVCCAAYEAIVLLAGTGSTLLPPARRIAPFFFVPFVVTGVATALAALAARRARPPGDGGVGGAG